MHPLPELPLLTADLPSTGGAIRSELSDFCVEEIPAYGPSGHGEHCMLHIRKRGLTTPEAVKRLAHHLGCDVRAAGWAGLKDKHAITTQWISLHRIDCATVPKELDGIEVIEAAPHAHKIRTGHLTGNRFRLRVRNVAPSAGSTARQVLERLERLGAPNYFGEQRFGTQGSNVDAATAWLVEGGKAPRDRFARKLFVSVLQSCLFNEVLAERVVDGRIAQAVEGDVMRKEATGGLFVATGDAWLDVPQRVDSWELSPTGPMFGAKMKHAEGEAAERERRVLARWNLDDAKLEAFARYGEGARRTLRVRPLDWSVAIDDTTLELAFTLPKGAYATTILREIMKVDTVASLDIP